MKNIPLVSICIPTYNQANFIAETLDSCLRQTYSNIEIVVVDDASTDGTSDIVRRFISNRPQFRFIQNSQNQGVEKSWNIALSSAKGEFIKILCGDDLLMPECIKKQVEAFKEYSDLVLVGCSRNIINSNSKIIFQLQRDVFLNPTPFYQGFRKVLHSGTNIIGEPACVLFRKSSFSFDGSLPYMIDLDFWFKIWETGNLLILKETLASFRVHSSSLTYSIGLRHFFQYFHFARNEVKKHKRHTKWFDCWIAMIHALILDILRNLFLKLRRN